MANRQDEFGATNSSDVKLRIFGPDREEYEGNPLHLHSQLLQKSDFFKALLSDRWSSDNRPFEIEVVTCQPFDNYVKCIIIISSSSPVRFSTVEECMAILPAASELLVDDLMQQCMQYLEAVPWNSEQESNINHLLTSLHLKVLPDLNARLNKLAKKSNLDIVLRSVKQMISFISEEHDAGSYQPNIREAVGKFIAEKMQEDECSVIADMLRNIILEEFKANIAVIVSSKENARDEVICATNVVTWSFNVIERCDGTTMEAAVKRLCDQVKLTDIIAAKQRETFVPILLGCLEALGKGKIIAERKVRAGFIATWLPVTAQLIHFGQISYNRRSDYLIVGIGFHCELKKRLCKAVINVMETLPSDDCEAVNKIWVDCCNKYDIDLSIPFAWCCKQLQEPQD